jgi:dephospho-CoA kinase
LRSSLGKLIFADASKKRALEEYLHPKIKDAITKESIKQDKLGFAYIIDIPLFFETKNYDIKESVVVYAPKELQLARLMKRDGFSKEEALGRIESQMDLEKKKALATWVIDNSKDLAHLQDECERFVDLLKSR